MMTAITLLYVLAPYTASSDILGPIVGPKKPPTAEPVTNAYWSPGVASTSTFIEISHKDHCDPVLKDMARAKATPVFKEISRKDQIGDDYVRQQVREESIDSNSAYAVYELDIESATNPQSRPWNWQTHIIINGI
jgi:hypothetical protein